MIHIGPGHKVSLFFLVLILVSCSTTKDYVKLNVRPDATFSKNATLTIRGEGDETGTRGELKHLLFEKGFNIVPYSTAKKAIKYKEKIENDDTDNTIEIEGEVFTVEELSSMYVLNLKYTYYKDYYGDYKYKFFSAEIVNLITHDMILTAKFRDKALINRVLKDFADKLNAEIE